MIPLEDIEVTPELLEAMEEQKDIEYRKANPPVEHSSWLDYSEDVTGYDLIEQGLKMLMKENKRKEESTTRRKSSSSSSSSSSSTCIGSFPVVG